MRKIYIPSAVQSRIMAIQVKGEGEEDGGPSMLESFVDPAYRTATVMGCLIEAGQQLSGVCVLVFYSTNIFISLGKSGPVGAAQVNFANFLGSVIGTVLLSKLGRKFSLVFWSIFMTACMFGMGVSFIAAQSCDTVTVPRPPCLPATLEVYFCMAFIFFFEFCYGVVPWIYLAEVMTNSGMAAGVATNQIFILLISLLSTTLINLMGGYAFIMFGGISVCVSTSYLARYCLVYDLLRDIYERDKRTFANRTQVPL